MAKRAALRGCRLELDEVGIDLRVAPRLDRHESGDALPAGDDRVIALDHDVAAAGAGEHAVPRRALARAQRQVVRCRASDRAIDGTCNT